MLDLNLHFIQLPVLLAALLAGGLALYIWQRFRTNGAQALAVLAGAVCLWTFGYFFELAAAGLDTKIFFARVQYIGIVLTPAAWLVFSLQYTGRLKALTRQQLAWLAIHPVLVVLLVWTNGLHNGIWREVGLASDGPFPVLDVTYGGLFWLHVLYTYTLFLLSTLFLLNMIARSMELYRGQASALLVSSLAPWVGNILFISDLSPYLDPSPFAFVISCAALTWAIRRFGLLDIVPIAHERVISSLLDGIIVINADNKIVNINKAARQITGYPTEPVIGKDIRQVLRAGPFRAGNHEVDQTIRTETLLDPGANQPRHLDIRISPIFDDRRVLKGRVVILRDISERKRIEHNLRRQALVFENIADSVIITDAHGIVVDCNPATEQLFGYSRYEIIDHKPDKWHPPGTYEPIEAEMLATIKRDGRWQGEIPYIRKDGHSGFADITVVPLYDTKERMVAFIAVVRDITQRKETERLLREAKESAEETSRSKSAFLANMSHEFRTPLTAILGYAELIEDELHDGNLSLIAEDIKKIRTASNHMLELVDGVLSIAKIEAGKVDLQINSFNLRQLLDDIVVTVQPLASKNNNQLDVVCDPAINTIRSDPVKVRQILFNLMSNATKFTHDGLVKIEVTPITLHTGAPCVQFRIQDTGIGITEENLAFIFDAFKQADSSSTREYEGTGLGLTITQHFCDMLGGSIHVESTPGAGSTFTVILPLNFSETRRNRQRADPSLEA